MILTVKIDTDITNEFGIIYYNPSMLIYLTIVMEKLLITCKNRIIVE
jgi:hypothetical protein